MGVGSPVGVLAAAVLGVESLAMIDCFSVVEGVSLVFGGGMGDWVIFFFLGELTLPVGIPLGYDV